MLRLTSQGQHISSSTKIMSNLTKDFLNSRYNTKDTSNLHKNCFCFCFIHKGYFQVVFFFSPPCLPKGKRVIPQAVPPSRTHFSFIACKLTERSSFLRLHVCQTYKNDPASSSVTIKKTLLIEDITFT